MRATTPKNIEIEASYTMRAVNPSEDEEEAAYTMRGVNPIEAVPGRHRVVADGRFIGYVASQGERWYAEPVTGSPMGPYQDPNKAAEKLYEDATGVSAKLSNPQNVKKLKSRLLR